MKNHKEAELEKIGAKFALKIGLPIGLIFSMVILYFSLFSIGGLSIYIIGGKLFWHPIVWVIIIPLIFFGLLWSGGKKLRGYILKGFSSLKSSFYFTLYVNVRLFSIIAFIFIIGGIITSFEIDGDRSSLNIIGLGLKTTLLTFLITTSFTTLTIGLAIVKLTEKKISVTNTFYS